MKYEQDNRLIIIVPISPTTAKKVQVAYEDCGEMHWEDAKRACANLGSGWRLPTPKELLIIYNELHLKGKGNFLGWAWYWCCEESHPYDRWTVGFPTGIGNTHYGHVTNYVRAVRDL